MLIYRSKFAVVDMGSDLPSNTLCILVNFVSNLPSVGGAHLQLFGKENQ